MMLTWLADACRDTGYPVVELPGWQTRGHGPMAGAHGVVGHWTAGPPDSATSSNCPSLGVVRDGRPDLPGPLAHVLTGFDGTLYVVAAGLCFHAGASAWRGETDLNNTFVGNEVESPGGFIYTAAQRDVTPRLHAALLRRMGRSAVWSAAHFEVALPAGRKADGPARDMDRFRRTVAGYLAGGALPSAPVTQRGLSIVDAETKSYLDNKFATLVGWFESLVYGDSRDDTKDPGTHPFNMQKLAADLAAFRTAMLTTAATEAGRDAALLTAVNSLGEAGGTLDLDALRVAMRESAEQGAAAALSRLDLVLTEPSTPQPAQPAA